MKTKRFADRREAGRLLARQLLRCSFSDPVVLAMPRGGVPVALEIALALAAPLDLIFVRKIGLPYQPELAAAAVVNGDTLEIVMNAGVMAAAGLTAGDIDAMAQVELAEIARRRARYLQGRDQPALVDRTLILVDDGIATGASVRAAIAGLKRKRPRRLVLAVPVAAASTLETLRPLVDEIFCLETPEPFHAIGLYYRDFHQLADEEVVRALRLADAAPGNGA